MIPVEIYTTVYFVLLCALLIVAFLPNYSPYPLGKAPVNRFVSISLLVLTIGFIGLRATKAPAKYMGDTSAYTRTYEEIDRGRQSEFVKDIGFYSFMKVSTAFLSVQGFYILCAFMYVLLPYITFKKWFGELSLYIFITYVVAFSFLPFGINALRNGLASALFIYGLGFTKKKWVMYGLFILSISFHKGMILPTLAFILAQLFNHPKKILFLWLSSIPISLLFSKNLESIVLEFFSGQSLIQDIRAATYFSENDIEYRVESAFRVDFILYSSVAVFLGFWAIVKKKYNNLLYKQIYGLYVIANAIWILLIYAPYTNRIAYLSWFIMPIVLTVPFISNIRNTIPKNKKKLLYVILGSLMFTIFMELI